MRTRLSRTLGAGAAGAALAYLCDPQNGRRRRHELRDRTLAVGRRGLRRTAREARYVGGAAIGTAKGAVAGVRPHERDYDDVTLAHKVESEIFRPAGAPKGAVSVNVNDGVVELRGQLEQPEQIERLGAAAARVEGVKRVENLLHTPGSPAKHSPPSDPADVRRRAEVAAEAHQAR
ncbi:MAG: BON domain-containing protein [Conexibacter sp.]